MFFGPLPFDLGLLTLRFKGKRVSGWGLLSDFAQAAAPTATYMAVLFLGLGGTENCAGHQGCWSGVGSTWREGL
jgi:hypothetical protein